MNRNEDELKNNIYIATLLLKENIPVQRAVETKEGKLYSSLEEKHYVLFSKLQGEVLKDYFEGNYFNQAGGILPSSISGRWIAIDVSQQ